MPLGQAKVYTCGSRLNARDERRRHTSPSSYPLSFRPPVSPSGSQIDRIGERFSGNYIEDAPLHGRTASPETGSSTTSSEDEQHDYAVYVSRDLENTPIEDAYHSTEPRRYANGGISINTSYLECPQPHSALHTPVTPTTPYSAIHSSPGDIEYPPHIFDYSSYYPSSPMEIPPYSSYPSPIRQRPGVSHILHLRFIGFWINLNPLATVCSQSPRLVRAFQEIFADALQFAESSDMVNHALLAFSAADASINARGDWARQVRMAASKHAEECQRLLAGELHRFTVGERNIISGDYRGRTSNWDLDFKATRLSLFLLLCYGLCASDISYMQLTSHHLCNFDSVISAHAPMYQSDYPPLAQFPISSIFNAALGDGWRIRLFACGDDFNHGPGEEGLEIGHDTNYFDDLRRAFEQSNSALHPDMSSAEAGDGDKVTISREHRPYGCRAAPCQVSNPTPTPRRTPTPSGNDCPASPPMGLMDINFAALSEEININSNLHYSRIGDYGCSAAAKNNTNNVDSLNKQPNYTSDPPRLTYTPPPPMLSPGNNRSPTAGSFGPVHVSNHHGSSTSYIQSRVSEDTSMLSYSYSPPPLPHSQSIQHDSATGHGQYMYPIHHSVINSTSNSEFDPRIMQKQHQQNPYNTLLQNQQMRM
ncbi:hypothetical protein DFH27DRAFT_614242 [Peziza echinospora]|nr:hypothetical protein DFH27DRAFT_614242 [Peziza echinospora]